MTVAMTYHKMKVIDIIIIRIINEAIKKVKDMKRNIPFLHIKKKYWANLLCRKMRVRKLKDGKVDKDILNKRRCEAKIDEIEEITIL